jgi:type I restriction enzyme R subunit
VIQTALANPPDHFALGIRKIIEELMIQRMSENDGIVTRYMDDQEFQNTAFPILAKAIFETVRNRRPAEPT